MKKRSTLILAVVLVGLVWASVASAAVNLRFTPPDTVVSPGSTNRLAIMIDDLDANVRTIDIYVTYDTTVVSSVAGGAGTLFTDSGFFVFQGIENNVPGQWHGYAVVMGSGDFLEGPGELYYWEYGALADGTSPIIAVEAYVAAGDGVYYPDVILNGTTITVNDPLSAVGDVPLVRPELNVWPNPFNPRTSVSIDLPDPGYVRMAVYDLRGRELIVLHDGQAPAGNQVFAWDGKDRNGMPQPAGQYLVRMVTDDDVWTRKMTMVK